jgi:hypothetical protein
MCGKCLIFELDFSLQNSNEIQMRMPKFCDGDAWFLMYVLDSSCQNKNVAKRTISFGLLVQKLCKFEVQIILAMIDP